MSEKYRGYTITYSPPPIPIRTMDWAWASDNFDAEQESDGTWHSNGLCGHSASLEEAKRDIDEQIAEIEAEAADAVLKQTLDRQATEQALSFGRFLQSFDAILAPAKGRF